MKADDDEDGDGDANCGSDEDEAGKLDMYLFTSAGEGVSQGWNDPGAQPIGGLSPSQGVIRYGGGGGGGGAPDLGGGLEEMVGD